MAINKYNDTYIKFGDIAKENEDKRNHKTNTDTRLKNSSAIIYLSNLYFVLLILNSGIPYLIKI
jgi:hypothetical protein